MRQGPAHLAVVLQGIGEGGGATDSELSEAIPLLMQFRPRKLLAQIKSLTSLAIFRPATVWLKCRDK